MRFQIVSEKDLNELQDKNNAQSTHWQTNWAVRVMGVCFQQFLMKRIRFYSN